MSYPVNTYAADWLTRREDRRFEADRIEIGDYPAAFSDARTGASYWWVTDWVARPVDGFGVWANPEGLEKYPTKALHKAEHSVSLRLFRSLRELKGGEAKMADATLTQLMKLVEENEAAYQEVLTTRANLRKAAQSLAATGLLSKEDTARVNELFPVRTRDRNASKAK